MFGRIISSLGGSEIRRHSPCHAVSELVLHKYMLNERKNYALWQPMHFGHILSCTKLQVDFIELCSPGALFLVVTDDPQY